MAEIDDARLEALLRTTMRAEEAALPVILRPDDILRRRSRVRRERIRRSGMRLLLVAAVLILPLGALWAAGQQSAVSAPSTAAIIVRGLERQATGDLSSLEVLTAAPDGAETPILDVGADQLPVGTAGVLDASVSRDGWLALSVDVGTDGGEVTLIDLRRPDVAPMLLPGDERPAWGPDDRLWVAHGSPERIEALDPATGDREVVLDVFPAELADVPFQVTADGTGIVIRGGSPYTCRYGQQYDDQGWVTLRGAGSIERAITPVFDDGRHRTMSPRWGPLGVSAPPIRLCPGHTELEHVSGPDQEGAYLFWPPVSHDFVGAAYRASDEGVWMIGSVTDEGASLYRVGPTDPDVLPAVASWSGQADHYFITAMAPDDSLIAISAETDEPFGRRHLLIETSSGRATEVSGRVAGFLDPLVLSHPGQPAT